MVMENILNSPKEKLIKPTRVAFHTLGCKLNFSETATISRDFNALHFEKVAFGKPADLYVINTCSVTDSADKKLKYLVKKVLKQNPMAFIAAIGCYAQLQPNEIAAIDGVDLVLGATEKFKLIDYVQDLTKKNQGEVYSCEIEQANLYEESYSINDRTRAFLKVQDGCDYKCSYCTIPRARGISRSDTLENILKNAKKIVASGFKEIVLTGVNIGDYGKGEFGNKNHKHTFLDLISSLESLNIINRIRISSIEPNLLNNEIIDFVSKSKCFVPHFHIPLQSGSDKILKSMKRRYMSKMYSDKISQIKTLLPHACIGADVIVGYPGETENDFLKTYQYLNNIKISYLHVFTYSERPNTEALNINDIVNKGIRNKRSKILRALSVKKRRTFYESQLGKNFTVLFEGENKEGYITGYTENYIKVRAPWNPSWVNTLREVQLQKIDNAGYVRFRSII